MRFFHLILFSIFSLHSFAQDLSLIKTFIAEKSLPGSKIVYTDKLDKYDLESISGSLREDTLRNYFTNYHTGPSSNQFIMLTPDEKQYLQNEILQNNKHAWPDSLFEHARVITKNKFKRLVGRKFTGWPDFKKKYAPAVFTFSKPVYLRNNTLCFLYLSFKCGGLCGYGEAAIYVNKNGKWAKDFLLNFWHN